MGFFDGSFGGILGTIGNVISTGIANKANARENEKNRQFNAQQAQIDREWQEKMVQQERSYNSYANQANLMKAAGLNPYTLASGMAGSAVSSSSSANGAQASSGASHAMQAADFSQLANVGLMMAQTDKIKAETGKINEETKGQSLMNIYQEEANRIYKDLGRISAELGIEEQSARIAVENAQSIVLGLEAELKKYDLNVMKPHEVANLIAETALKHNQAILAKIQAAKTDQEIELAVKEFMLSVKVAQSTITANYASADASRASADLSRSSAALNDQTHERNQLTWDQVGQVSLDALVTQYKAYSNAHEPSAKGYKDNSTLGKITRFGYQFLDKATHFIPGARSISPQSVPNPNSLYN